MDDQPDPILPNHRLLKQLFLLDDDLDRHVLAQSGLSVARFNLLGHLAELGPLSASRLGRLMLCDKANITRLLDGLQAESLLERSPDGADGRRTRITLTPAGRARWEQASQAYQASLRARFAGFSPRQSAALHDLLASLRLALEAELQKM